MATAGAIYDVNKSYTDVFLVVGGVYIVATIIFGSIPLLQYFRAGSSPVDDLNGATRFETFRISTKRSTSRGSIANGLDTPAATAPSAAAATAADSGATVVSAYGAITSTMDVAGHGYGYGGGVPDWNDTRYGPEQASSPPTYGSWQ